MVTAAPAALVRWAPWGAGVAGGVVAAFQLRRGIIPLLDTVTYWSGARSVASGRPFGTNLAPSFSNFDAVEFVERSGNLPFVDFPLGYPTVAGLLGVVIGVRAALMVLTVAAMAAIAWLVARGPRHPSGAVAATWAAVGVLTVMLPASRLVTQGVLSEPAFMAVSLAYLLALLRYRDTGEGFGMTVALAMAAGLLRFIGAPLALLLGGEHLRRHRRPVAALGWTVLCGLPAALNVLWAAVAGGGHSPGWRGLSGDTGELMARSVGGWFDARQGDLRITYFGGEGAAWWSWVLLVAWVVAITYAAAGLMGLVHRRFPAPLELALAAAGIITAGLVAGMMGFDALVIPDNRLMLPAGVITLAGLVWSLPDIGDQARVEVRRWAAPGLMAAATVLWALAAVRPWNLGERFADAADTPPYNEPIQQLAPSVVITNVADGLHWDTGIPTAYAPLSVKALTGEPVDQEAILRALPCPMLRENAIVVLVDNALFGSYGNDVLVALVNEGRLVEEALPGSLMYAPTPEACE